MGQAETLLYDAYEALAEGDVDALLGVCTPDVTWHIPGRGPQAGTYRGEAGIREFLSKLDDLTGGTFRVDLAEVLVGEPYLVALAFAVAERNGRSLDARVVHVWEVRDGKLAQMWSHPSDQYAFDDFYGDSPAAQEPPAPEAPVDPRLLVGVSAPQPEATDAAGAAGPAAPGEGEGDQPPGEAEVIAFPRGAGASGPPGAKPAASRRKAPAKAAARPVKPRAALGEPAKPPGKRVQRPSPISRSSSGAKGNGEKKKKEEE